MSLLSNTDISDAARLPRNLVDMLEYRDHQETTVCGVLARELDGMAHPSRSCRQLCRGFAEAMVWPEC